MKPSEYRRCWIIGAGAIGSAVAGALRMGGRIQICLVGSSPHALKVKESGLDYRINDGGRLRLTIPVMCLEDVPPLDRRDLVLLTQKLPAIAAQAGALRSFLHPETGIIALQNGWGVEPYIENLLGRRIDRGLAFFGANSFQPGTLIVHPGRIRLKSSKVTRAFPPLLDPGVIECEISEDFRLMEWRKLVINCVANPLSGILAVGNRRVIQPQLNPVKEQIIAEALAVAEAEGVSLDITVERMNRWLDSDNTPSMLADLKRGHATEIDFINGAVIRMAEKHGIPVPTHRALLSMIRFLERKKSVSMPEHPGGSDP